MSNETVNIVNKSSGWLKKKRRKEELQSDENTFSLGFLVPGAEDIHIFIHLNLGHSALKHACCTGFQRHMLNH